MHARPRRRHSNTMSDASESTDETEQDSMTKLYEHAVPVDEYDGEVKTDFPSTEVTEIDDA